MRTGLTIAVHLGGEITELLSGFETSIDEQRANFKKLQAIKTHEVFERVEYWEKDSGRVKQHKFQHVQAPVEAPIPNPAGAIMAALVAAVTHTPDPQPAPEPVQEVAEPVQDEDEEPAGNETQANGFDAAPRKRGRPPKSITG